MPRILGILVAAVMAVLLAAPVAAPAQAQGSSHVRSAVAQRALPTRPITINITQTRATTHGVGVKIAGKATSWRGKTVYLQKKRNGVFRTIDKDRTNSEARYVFHKFLQTGTHRFRVKVPKGNGYARSYSRVAGGRVS
jgi:hypothetical protein